MPANTENRERQEMTGKIDKDGHLWINRAGTLIKQQCRSAYEDTWDYCGHECPLFEEPYKNGQWYDDKSDSIKDNYDLAICKKTLHFDEFTDERGGQGE